MLCPKCSGEFLARTLDDVRVDECMRCHGVWFDRDELRLAKDESSPDLRWMDIDLWNDHDLFHVSEHALSCPRCQVKMAAVQYGPTGVLVDTCVKCHGVWLDKGEFEQIVNALEEQISGMSSQEYRHTALKEARELIAGPESFISEWRDFRTVMRLFQYRVLVENPKVQEALTALSTSSPFK